ncbi:MAG: DUF3459 domain-containing protein [Chloroflexi bacterium AL-W]|nr:DUF3459 domain-containing protein [Chloroflexi bacterium AL-N1]NOK67446.1 DUF3459 domain-containing protein [Chloroflexi bacterium AL-N10]NOK75062.1 DUF3459 domain-containing protein [Chloroflexi bacterium AL-N5]NOK81849.1 DUF3459 domain-containing protein [Chloroflexi bacterium AL-W]NOK89695.1 DUF3459 domain-containing protein [Chloroflexi bacterium AL-N15]
MTETEQLRRQASLSLERLTPRLKAVFESQSDAVEWQHFENRLAQEWERLFTLLIQLYGQHYDFFYHLEQLLVASARSWLRRPQWLKERDAQREADPLWFQSQRMLGGVLYVDLFDGTLANLQQRIPYFREIGLTYLHLMPLFAAPDGESDGGYAVSSYRQVNPSLGTMQELANLAKTLHEHGISLVIDFVFNHTSDEHEWAQRARAGDSNYQDFYYLFPDRTMPDAYERTLREIFPTIRRGSFTYRPDIEHWVWTTFNSFQWDLNYSNPSVFRAMAEEMLFLANNGIEILRLDAVAFIWKRLGTSSENQPEAHSIMQAFNALARIAAPSLLFKSEAIVHPDEVVKYISSEECQLSYNPLLMALLWEALATREVRLLAHSMRKRFQLPHGCAWVNYLRSHDDIGWTFDDHDAQQLGIDAFGHRQFLNAFYTSRFAGSFAYGLPFQENPDTGDARISGTLASLAGLEQAMQSGEASHIDLAIQRILLLHSIILSIGGIPLIYLGDEMGTTNDYSYVNDNAKAGDNRWVHRPQTDWQRLEQRHNPTSVEGTIFAGLAHLIQLRKEQQALWNGGTQVIESGNLHVFGYIRQHKQQRLLIMANFSEQPQVVDANQLRIYGLGYRFTDLITGHAITSEQPLHLDAYQYVWLEAKL